MTARPATAAAAPACLMLVVNFTILILPMFSPFLVTEI
jgi:hypothetical protein